MIHSLKIGDEYLSNLLRKKKLVEIRYNDRDYQVGDMLSFIREIEDHYIDYQFKILHVHSGLGMKDGYVALSVERISTAL